MKKTRLITAAIILALLIGGFWLFRQSAQRRAKEQFAGLETEPVRRGALFSTIEASGIVRANQSALLTWETSGQVDWIAGNPGTAVSEGQTLAQLRENTLPAEIILAQADLVNLQRQLDTLLNSSLAQAEALKAIEQAEQDLEDAHHPEMAQAQALQAVANAKNDLETAQTQLAILTKPTPQSAIEQAYANKLLAKKQLEDLQDEIARTERKSKGPFAPWESAKMYKRILDGLQLQLPQAQLRYEQAVNKYENLLEPPDPVDIAIARAAVFAAQAQLDDARTQYKRIENGYSEADIAVLEAQLADAHRAYDRIKDGPPADDVAALQAQIAAAKATIAQASISAPFDGVLTEVHAQPGDQVTPGTPAFRLDDLSALLVDASISEVDINRVQIGQEVIITLDAVFAREYHGKLVEIAPVGTENSGVTGFPVTVEILDADAAIRPGMSADIRIVIRSMEDVLLIPSRALRMENEVRVVYVLPSETEQVNGIFEMLPLILGGQPAPNSITPVPVTLGVSADGYSEVLNGNIKEGDLVVLNPPE